MARQGEWLDRRRGGPRGLDPATSHCDSLPSIPQFRRRRHSIVRSGARRRRIPHVLVGGRSFHDREEVIALRNAITAIEWPDDELKVFATLRGPFFALGDEALLAFISVPGPRPSGFVQFQINKDG